MIPTEIAALATLIYPHWPELDDDPGEMAALRDVMAAARRIHDAGYRLPNGDHS